MILGLTGNRTKERLLANIPSYVEWLSGNKVDFLISTDFINIPGLEENRFASPDDIGSKCDVLLSFGGDGTLLNTIKLLKGRETPVLGINFGGLGYMTEVNSEELIKKTEELLADRWKIERRLILEVSTEDGLNKGPWYALNDAVIDKAGYARLIQLRASIDNQFLNTFRADGLIFSTPTGSTAYSLSAGGPILEPNMKGILINPLNPHALSNRPLVIGEDKEIRVEARTPVDSVNISVDGLTVCQLRTGETVVIKRAPFSACLVSFEDKNFYAVLREKLGWGKTPFEID